MTNLSTDPIPVILAHEPSTPGVPQWTYTADTVSLGRSLEPKEVLIRMVASGICHTDVFVSSLPTNAMPTLSYPKVLGHEGAGYIEAIGDAVTVGKVGDRVLLSFTCCEECNLCTSDHKTYCEEFQVRNIIGDSSAFKLSSGSVEEPGGLGVITKKGNVVGKFLGQSSFASKSIVQENCVVNAQDLLKDEEEMKLLCPLGCGFMTGVGTVVNMGAVNEKDIVLVTGIGAVGFGAIMAAKIRGAKAIIAVDRVAKRLELAKELGATHVYDTSGKDLKQVAPEIMELVGGQRISFGVETTGNVAITEMAFAALGRYSKLVLIGVFQLTDVLSFPAASLFFAHKTVQPTLLGDSNSKEIVTLMIDWWRQGKFPVEKLVKYFPAKDVADALHGMESGSAVKPVLVW